MNTATAKAAPDAARPALEEAAPQTYTTTAKALHWLHAALIVGLLVLGWTMADMPQGPAKTANYALHKSLGLCALLLALLRLAWRLGHRSPPLPAALPAWQHKASHWMHRMIYVLFLAAPVAGYLSASFTKYPMKFFGVVLPKTGWPDEALNHLFNGLHVALTTLLAAAIALHVAAAISHAFKRDGVMDRMSFFRRRSAH